MTKNIRSTKRFIGNVVDLMASFVIIIAMIIMVIFMAGRRRIFAKRISKLRRRTERHRCQPFGSQVALVAILTLRRRRGMGMMERRIGMRRRIGIKRKRIVMMGRRIGIYNGEENLGEEEENNLEN